MTKLLKFIEKYTRIIIFCIEREMLDNREHIYSNVCFYDLKPVPNDMKTRPFHYSRFITGSVHSHIDYKPVQYVPGFVFWLLFIPILYVFWNSLRLKKQIRSLLECYTYISALKKGENVKAVFSSGSFVIFGFSFLLSVIFLVNMAMDQGTWFKNGIKLTGYFLLFFALKFGLIYLAGFISNKINDLRICLYYYINMISFSGLALVPILMLLIYADVPFFKISSLNIWIARLTLLVIYIYGLGNILGFVRKNHIAQSFHIILYLCTFELLPLLLAGKYLMIHKIIVF